MSSFTLGSFVSLFVATKVPKKLTQVTIESRPFWKRQNNERGVRQVLKTTHQGCLHTLYTLLSFFFILGFRVSGWRPFNLSLRPLMKILETTRQSESLILDLQGGEAFQRRASHIPPVISSSESHFTMYNVTHVRMHVFFFGFRGTLGVRSTLGNSPRPNTSDSFQEAFDQTWFFVSYNNGTKDFNHKSI